MDTYNYMSTYTGCIHAIIFVLFLQLYEYLYKVCVHIFEYF